MCDSRPEPRAAARSPTLPGDSTDDRSPAFDIYLPDWLAARNKLIFGIVFILNLIFATGCWLARLG